MEDNEIHRDRAVKHAEKQPKAGVDIKSAAEILEKSGESSSRWRRFRRTISVFGACHSDTPSRALAPHNVVVGSEERRLVG